jgi:hypothetical protein
MPKATGKFCFVVINYPNIAAVHSGFCSDIAVGLCMLTFIMNVDLKEFVRVIFKIGM